MESAPELVELATNFFEVYVAGDFETFADMHSKHESFSAIGTDELEWWDQREDYLKIIAVQQTELSALAVELLNPRAWKEGNLGWVTSECCLHFAEIDDVKVRLTMVFRREGPYWRTIHWHMSAPVPAMDMLGMELTTSLDSLLHMAHDESMDLAANATGGVVVLMFTDIEGSTVLLEALGEARWMGLHGWHDQIVRQQVAMFGGNIVKGQGDGFMVTFAAPGAAVAAAQGIQRALSAGFDGVRVPVRIGIHSGNAQEEGGDFFGKTVVVAARVAASANGGEVFVTQHVFESLGGAFPAHGPTSLVLKGINEPCDVFSIDWD